MTVRQGYIKNICKTIMKDFGDRVSTSYEQNKELLNELFDIQSKEYRNKIAGYLVVLKKKEGKIITPPKREKKARTKKEKIKLRRRRQRKRWTE